MKLCMDCRYFIVNGAKCGRSILPPDYVLGHPANNYSAQVERESKQETDCGPGARFFEIIPVAVDA